MTSASQSALSLQYVSVLVTAASGTPTSGTVQMAFTLAGSPQSDGWITAAWAEDTSLPSTQGIAQCLVGPGGAVTLAPGTYGIWVQITDLPEIPVLPAGTLSIY